MRRPQLSRAGLAVALARGRAPDSRRRATGSPSITMVSPSPRLAARRRRRLAADAAWRTLPPPAERDRGGRRQAGTVHQENGRGRSGDRWTPRPEAPAGLVASILYGRSGLLGIASSPASWSAATKMAGSQRPSAGTGLSPGFEPFSHVEPRHRRREPPQAVSWRPGRSAATSRPRPSRLARNSIRAVMQAGRGYGRRHQGIVIRRHGQVLRGRQDAEYAARRTLR